LGNLRLRIFDPTRNYVHGLFLHADEAVPMLVLARIDRFDGSSGLLFPRSFVIERKYLVRRFIPFKLKLLVAVFPLFALSCAGCSPAYVFRAAYEEGKILWRRQPIEEALQKTDLDPKTRDQFKLVLDVREYARDQLKFNVKGSYASYSYVDRANLTYVLMAAPKTDLRPYTWWFLIIGRVPYRGFFSQQEALAEAQALEKQGYDTYIRTSAAFSTLGWFDDPLLAHLLRYERVTLAETIFHELFHNTLYVGSAGDFNESLANFVGHRAAILFFRERYGEKSAEHLRAVESWNEALEFSGYISGVGATLKDLYAKDLPEEEKIRLREKIFSDGQKYWAQQIAGRSRHRYRSFTQDKINNAVLANHLLYLKDLEVFESVYEATGKDLARSVVAIKEAVRSRNPFADVRVLAKKLNGQDSQIGGRDPESSNGVDVGGGS
jgi:predicted aminopeptidase